MTARIRRHLAADQGFTLPELLINTVIMGVIVAAIGAALITALRLYAQPAQKLGPSNDANLLANYITADVQSATTNEVAATAPSGCTYPTPVGSVNVLALSWSDNAPTVAVAHAVAYQFNATAGTLTRVKCVNGGVPQVSTIGRNIVTASADFDAAVSSIEVSLTARDPEAPTTDVPFAFKFRAYGRLAGSDNGGGGGGPGPAVLPKGAVTGEVLAYADLAGTGVGTPLPSVAVTLTDGTFTATRSTGVNGRFYIGTVPAGSYTLSISPASYIATTASALSTSVTVGSVDVTSNFGVVKVGSITGLVRTAAAGPVSGATVTLAGPAPNSVVTGAGGTYTFANLPTGSYTVTVSAPGYTVSSGSPCGPTAIDGNAFGCPDAVLAPSTYMITGLVRTPANAPISGATVNLSGAATNTTSTNATGQFTFTVVNGAYTVTVSTPAGHTLVSGAPCNVTVANANQTCADAVFSPPVVSTATVSGFVRRDLNGDNNPESDMAGVTVTLSPGGATAVTAADGSFAFTSVAPGAYTVTQTVPSGFTQIVPSTSSGGLAVNVSAAGVASPASLLFVDRFLSCWLDPTQPTNSVKINSSSGVPNNNQNIKVRTNVACAAGVEIRLPAATGSPGPPTALILTAATSGGPAVTYTSANMPASPAWNIQTGSFTAAAYSGSTFLGNITVIVT